MNATISIELRVVGRLFSRFSNLPWRGSGCLMIPNGNCNYPSQFKALSTVALTEKVKNKKEEADAVILKLIDIFEDTAPPPHDNAPLIIDVRDPEEVSAGKGGPPNFIEGSINVPLNHEGVPQKIRHTTLDEFLAKLEASGANLPSDKTKHIVTHCGSGGRGGKAAEFLRQAGYVNTYNGGCPAHIGKAIELLDWIRFFDQ